MNRCSTIGILFLLALLPSKVFSQDPNFHIYLAFGQSNMEGAGLIEAQDNIGVDARFRVMGALTCTGTRSLTLGQWTTATPPLVRCYTNLGVADYFGRTMVENISTTIKVGIVPVAVGGCSITLFDKVNYASYVSTAPSWMKDIITQYGGNPYKRLVDVAKLAQKDGVIKGIIFHQGETNTNDPLWKDAVKEIIKNLKKDLGLGDIPFLAGELLTGTGSCCSSHNAEIIQLPDLIPNAHIISSAELTGTDNAHFTSASYRTFGERYAKKMLTLVDINPVPIITANDDALESSIKIYPTPVLMGSFTLQNVEKITQVELFTLTGQKIGTFDNSNHASSLDIQLTTTPGIVILKLSTEQKTFYAMKVLVQ